jgi:hypothetical protein
VAFQGASLGNILTGYNPPEDGGLQTLVLNLKRVAGGDIEITGSYGGNGFSTITVTNSAINNNTFDMLGISINDEDMGLKIDNVLITTSVELAPPPSPYEQWTIDSGLTNGIDAATDNPDGDALDNFGEYVFGGSPTNGADIGTEPVFDANGDYIYVLRNDDSLVASILTRLDLVIGDWTTNAPMNRGLDDQCAYECNTERWGNGQLHQ